MKVGAPCARGRSPRPGRWVTVVVRRCQPFRNHPEVKATARTSAATRSAVPAVPAVSGPPIQGHARCRGLAHSSRCRPGGRVVHGWQEVLGPLAGTDALAGQLRRRVTSSSATFVSFAKSSVAVPFQPPSCAACAMNQDSGDRLGVERRRVRLGFAAAIGRQQRSSGPLSARSTATPIRADSAIRGERSSSTSGRIFKHGGRDP